VKHAHRFTMIRHDLTLIAAVEGRERYEAASLFNVSAARRLRGSLKFAEMPFRHASVRSNTRTMESMQSFFFRRSQNSLFSNMRNYRHVIAAGRMD
jgi:hypothetical protein